MYVDIEVTKNCNLRCSYCYVKDKTFKYLTIENAEKIVHFILDRANKKNIRSVIINFLGGEPLLNFDIIKYIVELTNNLSKEKNIKVSYAMTTNGTLFSNEIASFCINNDFDIKLSIDGTKHYNDLNRKTPSNSSSYDLLYKNLDNFYYFQSKLRKSVQASMVITKNNYKNFSNNIKHVFSLGLNSIDTALNFYDDWNENDFEILENEFLKTVEYIFECEKQGKPCLWTVINNCLKTQITPSGNYFCGAGDTSLYFAVDGYIYACAICQKDGLKVGDIHSGIYENNIIDFCKYERQLTDKCNNCNLKNTCRDCDCIALNYELSNNIFEVPYVACSLSKVVHKLSDKIINNPEWVDILHKKFSHILKAQKNITLSKTE